MAATAAREQHLSRDSSVGDFPTGKVIVCDLQKTCRNFAFHIHAWHSMADFGEWALKNQQ